MIQIETNIIKKIKYVLDKYGVFIMIFPTEGGLEVTIVDETIDAPPTKYNLHLNESFENRFKELIEDFEEED